MHQVKKVVLAYSGGVDTSVCIPYLKNEYGISEVVAFVADLGQGEDLELIRQKALNSGASKSIVGNLVKSFVEKFAFPAIRANALYLDKYPLSTALARPLIAENLVNIAREINADAVAHGCTGKGNDQVRFDLAINALGPDLKIITPAREWKMSREEAILYGEKFGIPAPVSKKSPYSIDVNLLGRSIEAGILEDPMQEAPEDIFEMTSSIDNSPDCIKQINKNLQEYKNDYSVLKLDVSNYINEVASKYDIVFYDPPFEYVTEDINADISEIGNNLNKNAFIVIHRHSNSSSIVLPNDVELYKEKYYGQSKILILRKK